MDFHPVEKCKLLNSKIDVLFNLKWIKWFT
jgi:hypothetical protein